MNLIEKIDAEKVKIYKLYLINAISNEKFNGITEGLDRAKDIILSEQKEPCIFCKEPHGQFLTDGLFDQCRVQALHMFATDKYEYTLCVNNSAFREINYCPACGRPLNQPYTE